LQFYTSAFDRRLRLNNLSNWAERHNFLFPSLSRSRP
jgi:hypothetical protein